MSRLRRIFVEGDARTTHMALEDVLFLSGISGTTRAAILQRLHSGAASAAKLEIARDDDLPEVPELFLSVARQASRSGNAHYQQAIVVWYMLFDSELFGRFMLQNEPPQLQELFMKALKEMNTFFI